MIEFLANIRKVQYDKIPEPFFPVHGQLYESTKTRIVFVGMETRGWGNITDFVNDASRDPEEAIFREVEEFDQLEFCKWGNNFGKEFWDFNFKFLAKFYGIDDWKKLKNAEAKDILRSFAWGNTNSIEGFEVNAKGNGVNYDDWLIVKNASKSFDKGKYLLKVLQPNIMVILNWDTSEDWLRQGMDSDIKEEEIAEHFSYYFVPSSQTHVLWTAHPSWLSKNKLFDDYVNLLVDFAKKQFRENIT